MRLLSTLTILALASAAWTQQAPSRLVTRQEFAGAVWALERAANKVLGMKEPAKPKTSDPGKTATRAEIVARLSALFTAYRPRFKSTPRPHYVRPGYIESHLPASARTEAETLVKWGFVAPVGALVTGPLEGLTARQAGDVLGVFFCQLSYCAHVPEPKWTPNIMPEG